MGVCLNTIIFAKAWIESWWCLLMIQFKKTREQAGFVVNIDVSAVWVWKCTKAVRGFKNKTSLLKCRFIYHDHLCSPIFFLWLPEISAGPSRNSYLLVLCFASCLVWFYFDNLRWNFKLLWIKSSNKTQIWILIILHDNWSFPCWCFEGFFKGLRSKASNNYSMIDSHLCVLASQKHSKVQLPLPFILWLSWLKEF